MKRWLSFVGTLALLAGMGSCIFVTDDHCPERAMSCDGEIVEECIDDEWWVVEDCWSLCGGYCDFNQHGDPVCVC